MTITDATPLAPAPAQVREPLMYGDHSRESFFRDIVLAQLQRDPAAKARLARHGQEMVAERAARDRVASSEFSRTMQTLEARANPSSTLGSGGEFDVPLSMLDKFASAGRAGRTLADLVGSTPLPAGISSIHIPRMTTGSQTTTQIDIEAVAGQDLVTSDITSPVVTISGQLDVSQQLYDQAPAGFDTYAFLDLSRAYNRNLEQQMINGSSVNGQMQGVVNVAGANVIDGSTATTFSLMWPLLGRAGAAVGNNRLLPPELFLLAPRRWFWIASSLDSSSRPIATPGNGAPQPSQLLPAGGANPIGPLLGLPGYMDGALNPAAPFTGSDSALALRPSDMFLFEGAPRLMVAANPLSESLQIRLSLHRYVAFVSARYPTGISVLANMPAPAGF